MWRIPCRRYLEIGLVLRSQLWKCRRSQEKLQISSCFRHVMERLNADIIFMVCCYLDLGSLSSLAAALPHWSSVIFGTLKTRVWAIKMVSEYYQGWSWLRERALRYQLPSPHCREYEESREVIEMTKNLFRESCRSSRLWSTAPCLGLSAARAGMEPRRCASLEDVLLVLEQVGKTSIQESPRMNLVLCDWEGLQASIWKHVPFDMLKIAIFDVTQVQ